MVSWRTLIESSVRGSGWPRQLKGTLCMRELLCGGAGRELVRQTPIPAAQPVGVRITSPLLPSV